MANHNVWMPLFVADLIADTTHLSRADFGSYVLLMCSYWRRRKPLADDERALSAAARATLDEWKAIAPCRLNSSGSRTACGGTSALTKETSRQRYEGNRRGAEKTNSAQRNRKETPTGALSDAVGGVQSQSQSHSVERAPLSADRPSLEEVLAYVARLLRTAHRRASPAQLSCSPPRRRAELCADSHERKSTTACPPASSANRATCILEMMTKDCGMSPKGRIIQS